MGSPTFRRSLAVLTLGIFGGTMAFMAGASVGAALDGHVTHLTLAHAPMPQISVKAPESVTASVVAKK